MDIKNNYLNLIKLRKKYLFHLNFFITDFCNKNCIYCFEKKNFQNNKYISLIDIKKIFNFLNRVSKKGLISLIGGEPLLHPQFNKIIDNNFNKLKHDIHIYTNGSILLYPFIDNLKDKFITFSLHYNINDNFKIFKKNIELCEKNNIKYQVNIVFFNCNNEKFINQINEITKITNNFIFTQVHDYFNEDSQKIYDKKFIDFIDKFQIKDFFINLKNKMYKKNKICFYNEIDLINDKNRYLFYFNECFLKSSKSISLEFKFQNYNKILSLIESKNNFKCNKICPNDFAFYGSVDENVNDFNINS